MRAGDTPTMPGTVTTMDLQDLRDRLSRLDAALADIQSGSVTATLGERAYIAGARDALQTLLSPE
jgi:hypothetical protein